MRKLLCFLGIHKYIPYWLPYSKLKGRECKHCGKRQILDDDWITVS